MLNGMTVRAIRVAKGLTLHDVATRAGVSTQWLSAVELGQAKLSRNTEERLIRVFTDLGITEEDILAFRKAVDGVVKRQ